jgi:predicted nucleic acid-binding protein
VQLIVIIGMLHQPKAALTRMFIEALSAETDRLALLDNSDASLGLDGVTRQRLAGGCVCCSLAAALIPLVWRLDAEYVLLPVSASADPEALAFMLDSLRGERIRITTIALIDALTQDQHPHLARKLAFYSDLALYEPFDYQEAVHAAVRLSL